MAVSEPAIAVTGATGFIGRALCARAASGARAAPPGAATVGSPLRALVRDRCRAEEVLPSGVELVETDLETAGVADLARTLTGVAAVVHLAGRAHVIDEHAADPDSAYRRANVDITAKLAEAAVAAGVGRFVFASTIKVNGESTLRGRPFRPDDAPRPGDAYARSKHAAEVVLERIAQGTPMLPLILRLPLVYGPHAHGNFRRLVDAVAARQWLPFGAIDNRRSLLGLPNLLDAIDAALRAMSEQTTTTGTSARNVHLIADAAPVSTPELVRAIARALGVKARLFPVPVGVLRVVGALTGRAALVERLTGSLEVDSTSFARATGWRTRPFAIDAAMLEPRSSR
ncbi:MAG: NAD-dependent epimerase/dehydratase family protein [Betaproteobacteria bacterium]|nr:NAD-dependent epimerase/dehydratase family protein [Betaproteobacteria bacterium]